LGGREVAVGSDEQGRLSGFELPDGRQVTFSYDGDGR
jgi:YD repeat-containing protein